MTQETAIKLIINFWHDDEMDSPCDEDGWKVYSFNRRHNSYKDPEGLDNEDVADKLKNGLAFRLGYYEHGQCVWSLSGEGPNCRWDSHSNAGLLIWENEESDIGSETYEDRERDARAFIKRYTEWCNGEIYGYTISVVRPCHACGKDEELDDSEHNVDTVSHGNYYASDIDYMLTTLKDTIGSDWADYAVTFTEDNGYGLADKARKFWKEQK